MQKQSKTVLVTILALFSFAIPSTAQAMSRKCATLLRILKQHEHQNRYFEVASLTLKAPRKHADHLFAEAKSLFGRILLASRHPDLVSSAEEFIADNVRQLYKEAPDLALLVTVLTHRNPPTELLTPLLNRVREHLTRVSAELEIPQGAQFTPEAHFRALKLLGESVERPILGYNPPVDEAKSKFEKRAWLSKHWSFEEVRLVRNPAPKIPLQRAMKGFVHDAEPRCSNCSVSKVPDFGTTAFLDKKISEEDFLTENAIAYLIVFGDESDLRLVKGLAEMKYNSLYELFVWRLSRGEPGFPK